MTTCWELYSGNKQVVIKVTTRRDSDSKGNKGGNHHILPLHMLLVLLDVMYLLHHVYEGSISHFTFNTPETMVDAGDKTHIFGCQNSGGV